MFTLLLVVGACLFTFLFTLGLGLAFVAKQADERLDAGRAQPGTAWRPTVESREDVRG